jgi:hypothetical protein
MPDVTHPPVYTAWIAALFAAAGKPAFLLVQLSNAAMSAGTCVLLGLWVERAGSRELGRLAGLWCAFDPLLIFFAPQLQSEPFFLFLELAFFLGLQKLGDRPAALGALALGFFGGVLNLTRSVLLFFPVFFFGALKLTRRWSWAWLLLLIGWGALPFAWGVRNQRRYGQFIPLASNGGWNLWEGFTLDREDVRRRPELMAEELRQKGVRTDLDLKAAGDYFSRKTQDFIKAHPVDAAKIVLGKFFLYWRPWPYEPHNKAIRSVLAAYFTVLFAFALYGAAALWRDRSWLPAWALIANLSAMHSVFFTSLRYRSPLEPFLCALGAAGLYRLLSSSRRSQT